MLGLVVVERWCLGDAYYFEQENSSSVGMVPQEGLAS